MNIEPAAPTVKNPPEQFAGEPHNHHRVERAHHRRRLPRPPCRRGGPVRTEIVEAITHLAFYAGWPRAMSAITTTRNVFTTAESAGEEYG